MMKTLRNIIRKEWSMVSGQWSMALLLLVAAGANAQTVTDARWNADGSALTVEYDLTPQLLKSNYSYILTPMLCSPTDTLTLRLTADGKKVELEDCPYLRQLRDILTKPGK